MSMAPAVTNQGRLYLPPLADLIPDNSGPFMHQELDAVSHHTAPLGSQKGSLTSGDSSLPIQNVFTHTSLHRLPGSQQSAPMLPAHLSNHNPGGGSPRDFQFMQQQPHNGTQWNASVPTFGDGPPLDGGLPYEADTPSKRARFNSMGGQFSAPAARPLGIPMEGVVLDPQWQPNQQRQHSSPLPDGHFGGRPQLPPPSECRPVAVSTASAPRAKRGPIELVFEQSKKKGNRNAPRMRLRWTKDLDARFHEAVNDGGGLFQVTAPQVLEMMEVDKLTLAHVKSHLQQMRLMTGKKGQPEGSGEPQRSHSGSKWAADEPSNSDSPVSFTAANATTPGTSRATPQHIPSPPNQHEVQMQRRRQQQQGAQGQVIYQRRTEVWALLERQNRLHRELTHNLQEHQELLFGLRECGEELRQVMGRLDQVSGAGPLPALGTGAVPGMIPYPPGGPQPPLP